MPDITNSEVGHARKHADDLLTAGAIVMRMLERIRRRHHAQAHETVRDFVDRAAAAGDAEALEFLRGGESLN